MSGVSEKTALELLYESALEQEMEILRLRKAAGLDVYMAWQPPTEEEFNNDWATPLDALDVSDERMAEDVDKWAIVQRLRAGQILAVARTGQIRSDLAGVRPFVPVPTGAWQRMGQNEEFYFWKTGDLVVTDVRDGVITGGSQRYFDIKFDPESFSGKPPSLRPEEGGEPAPLLDGQPPLDRPPLAKSEAERFCRSLLAGWPDLTQDWAYDKAVLFFPDKKVTRDSFRSILRSIRGPTKPGKRGNTGS